MFEKMDQEKKLTQEKDVGIIGKWLGEMIRVIIILYITGSVSNFFKDVKTYKFAYKTLIVHDKEIADLIQDLNKFKTEELKQRKHKLLEDSIWDYEKIVNGTIEDKTFDSPNFLTILQANTFIHDEEIKLLKEEIDRLKQKLDGKK